MKAKPSLLAVALATVGVCVGFAPVQEQKPKLAEQEYKNIQILKGLPASELHPSMEAMSAALGVQCTFCHVNENGEYKWESDDVDHKNIARKMFGMMKKINEENFEGAMEVTCATCHQGKSHPVGIAPIGANPAPASAAPANGTLPTADSLIAKYQAAIGDPSKVKSVVVKGLAKAPYGNLPFEAFAQGEKLTRLLTFPNGLYTQTYDGSSAWGHFGKELTQTEAQELLRYKLSSPYVLIQPKQSFQAFRRVRKEAVNGTEAFAVESQPKEEGVRVRLFFDASNGMLLRMWTSMQTVVGPVVRTSDFSDYREIGGVKMPYRIVETTSDGPWTFEFSEIKVNEEIPDSRFAKPGG
jgi:photosynthetic reaction center cytochrome c subunit